MARGTPHVTESCRPVTEILQLIGDKWTVLVVAACTKDRCASPKSAATFPLCRNAC